MSEYAIGVVCGILCGLLLILLILKLTKTDGSLRCKYDERQQIIRGRGFQYAFFMLMFYNVLFGLKDELFGLKLVDNMTGMFIGIVIGAMVYAVYCIWHEGYYSLNEKRGRVQIAFFGIGVINLLLSLRSLMHGTMIRDGVLTFSSINLLCAVLMFLLVFVSLAKNRAAGKETD